MTEIVVDAELVSACGLYCGACKAFLKGRCDGCGRPKNRVSFWGKRCKVRQCCDERELSSCAACDEFEDVAACRKQNSALVRLFAPLVGYDRPAGIRQIRESGAMEFARERALEGSMFVRRKR